MAMTSRPYANQTGFSLLEVLVAFSIMALSLGVLLRIFGGSGHIASTADDYSRAIITAESLMARTGVETPLEPGESQGETSDGYRWRLSVYPYPFDESLLGEQKTVGYKPYWVELEVEWGELDDPRAFSLTTLRLLPDKPLGGLK